MGDFKDALFGIVAACRSRGLAVDVAAWNGWKTPGSKPRADTVAILFFNSPGIYKLKNGLGVLHDRRSGFLVEEAADDDLTFDCQTGPGHFLDAYLPRNIGVEKNYATF